MFKTLVLVLGAAGGSAGTVAWLLSDPPAGEPRLPPGERIQEARRRFLDALAEGKKAGAQTENRLRSQLDAYRSQPDRPAKS